MALTKIDDRGLKTPIDLLDDEKIRLGTGNDLEIYHSNSSSNSLIDNISGQFILKSDDLRLKARNNEQYLKANLNGSVELYYDNSKKLQTYSAGTEVLGNLWLQSGGVYLKDSVKLNLGNSADAEIFHNGNNLYLDNKVGNYYIRPTSDLFIQNYNTGEVYIRGNANAAVELYYNGLKKFETHDVGNIITQASNGVANGSLKLNTTLDNYGSIIVRDQSHSHNSIGALQVENNGTGTNETNFVIRSVNNGSTAWANAWYAALSHKFAIQSNSNATPKVQIDSAGIKFNGDTAAANALYDYETGSHTASANGLSTGSVNTQKYVYVKIGNLVHIQFYITFTSTADSDPVQLSIPFTNSEAHTWCAFSAHTNRTSGLSPFVGRFRGNENLMEFKTIVGDAQITYSDVNGYWLIGGGTYRTLL